MSAALRTVKVEGGEVVYDSDMPMKALRGVIGAAGSNDLEGLMKGLSLFVKSWPFEGTPQDPSAWDDLRRSEFNAVVSAVMDDLGDLGNE